MEATALPKGDAPANGGLIPEPAAQDKPSGLVPVVEKPEAMAAFKADPYRGIAATPFPSEVAQRLMAPIDPKDVEIKPDGILYYPEIKYRRRLNEAFGVGGWAMLPRGPFIMLDNTLSREYALIAYGRFVAEARGEQDYIPTNANMSEATASEGVKSNAIMRCCKDLGIASELWDPNFINDWKQQYAFCVWVENVSKGDQAGKKKPMWRRKDRPRFDYPWREDGTAPVDNATFAAQQDEAKPQQKRAAQAKPLKPQAPSTDASAQPPTEPAKPATPAAKVTKTKVERKKFASSDEAMQAGFLPCTVANITSKKAANGSMRYGFRVEFCHEGAPEGEVWLNSFSASDHAFMAEAKDKTAMAHVKVKETVKDVVDPETGETVPRTFRDIEEIAEVHLG